MVLRLIDNLIDPQYRRDLSKKKATIIEKCQGKERKGEVIVYGYGKKVKKK
jgi:hypothetical protein